MYREGVERRLVEADVPDRDVGLQVLKSAVPEMSSTFGRTRRHLLTIVLDGLRELQ